MHSKRYEFESQWRLNGNDEAAPKFDSKKYASLLEYKMRVFLC